MVLETEERNAAKPHMKFGLPTIAANFIDAVIVSSLLDMFGLPTIAANIVGLLYAQAANSHSEFY